MAFIDNDVNEGESGGARYVKIIDGSLVEKASTALNEKYELFETENPETGAEVKYYIRRYKRIPGMIERLERVELQGLKIYGYNLHMTDEDGAFSIFFKDDAKVTDRLLKCFESFDLTQEVSVSVWKDDNGRPAIGFTQDGKNVKQAWSGGVVDGTWEGNLPEPKKSKGKWDYSPISEFLYNNAMENIIPRFAEAQAAADAAKEARADAKSAPADSEEAPKAKAKAAKSGAEDALPF